MTLLPSVSTRTEMVSPLVRLILRVSAVPADLAGLIQQPPQATTTISRMT